MRYATKEIKYTDKIKTTFLFKGDYGQDGAIYGDLLFRFETDGVCTVYSLSKKEELTRFTLDRVDTMRPHSNAVFFGTEKFDSDDEFPLLYTNIYNNYAKEEDRREGMCCVYRLTRHGDGFVTKLVQVLKIGFTDNVPLWKSLPDNGDIRPYGNYIIDVDKKKLYAYVMRDGTQTTRWFEFEIPSVKEGTACEKCGAKVFTLNESDIIGFFDTPYSGIIQGACAYDGKIFSLEGGTVPEDNPNPKWPPRMRIIDTNEKCEKAVIYLAEYGLKIEPEMIDFENDTLYYMDSTGYVYTIDFI